MRVTKNTTKVATRCWHTPLRGTALHFERDVKRAFHVRRD